MNDLDFYYAQMDNPFVERKPVRQLSDDELLQSLPISKIKDNFNPYSKPEEFRYRPSLPERIIDDAVNHPLFSADMIAEMVLPATNPIGWALPLADVLGGVYDYIKDTKIGKFLPNLESPYSFMRYMDENPNDWEYLIPGRGKLSDMQQNPEEYAE